MGEHLSKEHLSCALGEHLSEEKPSDPSEEAVPLRSASGEPEQLSEMCVDDPEPSNAVVVYGEEEFPMINQPPNEEDPKDDGGKYVLL